MLQFIVGYRNWLLAGLAACVWFGALGWYLWPIIRKAWAQRYDAYFRNW